MKLFKHLLCSISLVIILVSCDPSKKITKGDDDKIEIIIIQANDVYEIAPLEGGQVGGIARVAQIKKDLLAKNPNTIAVMAGDFLNPSVLGILKYEGERIKGKQMVETMNVAGFDLATFGNHEFDLNETDLQKRINESEFDWTCSNTFQKKGGFLKPFKQNGKDIPSYWIREFKDADGTMIKIGVIGVCLNSNQKNYVHYEDAFTSFKKTHAAIKDKVDIVIGLTHQSIDEDKALAAQVQGIPLFIGGHEHDNMMHKVGDVTITKADANAKTVYIHTFKYNKAKKKLSLNSTLKAVDSSIPFEPKTDLVVKKWSKIAYDALKKDGINPDEAIIELEKPINVTEDIIRYRPSLIGNIVVQAIAKSYPNAEAALMNTGSMRLDDMLSGKITQYDIVRLLPFGGGMNLVEIKGSLLLKILEIGMVKNIGNGGYFALERLTFDNSTKTGTINNKNIESDSNYKIALPSFLLTGFETNLDFFTKDNQDIINITEASTDIQKDVRLAVVDWLKNNPIPYK